MISAPRDQSGRCRKSRDRICSIICAWICTPGVKLSRAVVLRSARPAALLPTRMIIPPTSAEAVGGSSSNFHAGMVRLFRDRFFVEPYASFRVGGNDQTADLDFHDAGVLPEALFAAGTGAFDDIGRGLLRDPQRLDGPGSDRSHRQALRAWAPAGPPRLARGQGSCSPYRVPRVEVPAN